MTDRSLHRQRLGVPTSRRGLKRLRLCSELLAGLLLPHLVMRSFMQAMWPSSCFASLREAHGLDELLPELVRQLAAAEPSDPYQCGTLSALSDRHKVSRSATIELHRCRDIQSLNLRSKVDHQTPRPEEAGERDSDWCGSWISRLRESAADSRRNPEDLDTRLGERF